MAEQSLGHWLKERRKALKIIQAALARLIGYSEVYVRKIESDERLPTPDTLEKFAFHLCQPHEQAIFLRVARGELGSNELPDPTLPGPHWPEGAAPAEYPATLPAPLTSLIDREADVQAICERLLRSSVRLLTLVGPPGIGKTRVVLEVARQLAPSFDNSVYFVGLSAIVEPEGVAPAIARALGIRNGVNGGLVESLKAALGQKRTLLVLDNFEQVTLAAPLVLELLESTPSAKALLTSRTPLHLPGEHEFLVAPLACPPLPAVARADESVADYPAVALFLERAQAVRPQFRLTSANAEAVAAICARLEGVPLAIELAAAHVKSLTPQAILDRLQPYMARLAAPGRTAPSRHRTMRDAINWSYDLLDESEQVMFTRLGVFAGSFTLDAAEAVACRAADDDGQPAMDTLDAVTALIDKNFLQHHEGADGEGRYRMLEMIREYALERLAERGEREAVQQRHAAYYLALTGKTRQGEAASGNCDMTARLAAEQRNMETALQWALNCPKTESALQLCAALWPLWWTQGQLQEGYAYVKKALGRADAGATPPATMACARLGAGILASAQGQYAEAAECLQASLALWQDLGDQKQVAATLRSLGVVAEHQGNYAEATARFQAALDASRALDDSKGIAEALNFLGQVQLDIGDLAAAQRSLVEALPLVQHPEARRERTLVLRNLGRVAAAGGDDTLACRYFDEALAIAQAGSDVINIAKLNINVAETMLRGGDVGQASYMLKSALELAARFGDRRDIMRSLEGLAGCAAARSMPLMEARLLGAADRLRETMGVGQTPTFLRSPALSPTASDNGFDDTRLAAARHEGRTWTITQAVAVAMSV